MWSGIRGKGMGQKLLFVYTGLQQNTIIMEPFFATKFDMTVKYEIHLFKQDNHRSGFDQF